jgi:uncharacterized protein YjiS (DUF1127 family)
MSSSTPGKGTMQMMTMIRKAILRGREASRQRREMEELEWLDDRALKDIGLTRGDVIAARGRMPYWI